MHLNRTLDKATIPYDPNQLLPALVLNLCFALDAILRQSVDVIRKEMGGAFIAEE